ncbi:MAG: hypothetical protein R2879_17935 [Saprospiraceae bacterium]
MKDNFNQDRLEEFFRKSLEGYEENPPSDSWEKIRAGIPQKDKRRGLGAWLWLGLLLLALAFAGAQYFTSQRFETLEAQVEELNERQSATDNTFEKSNTENTQKKESEVKTEKENSGTIKQSNPGAPAPVGNKVFSQKTNQTRQSAIDKTKPGPISSDIQNESNENPPSKNEVNFAPFLDDTEEKSSVPLKNPAHSFDKEKYADLPEILNEEDLTEEDNSISEVIEEEIEKLNSDQLKDVKEVGAKRKGEESLLFPFELVYGIKTMAPAFMSGELDQSEQKVWDLAVLGDIPINNNWTFQMGLGYRKLNMSGTTEVRAQYSENGAIGNTDIGISRDYRFDVPNEVAEIAITGTLTQYFEGNRPEENLDPGDNMSFSTTVEHSTEHLIFPFFISGHTYFSRFGLRAKAGLVGTVQFGQKHSLSVGEFDNENLVFDFQDSRVTYVYGGPKVEAAFSGGLEFRVWEDFWIFGEPAINLPLIGKHTVSKPTFYGVQMGIIWKKGSL